MGWLSYRGRCCESIARDADLVVLCCVMPCTHCKDGAMCVSAIDYGIIDGLLVNPAWSLCP